MPQKKVTTKKKVGLKPLAYIEPIPSSIPTMEHFEVNLSEEGAKKHSHCMISRVTKGGYSYKNGITLSAPNDILVIDNTALIRENDIVVITDKYSLSWRIAVFKNQKDDGFHFELAETLDELVLKQNEISTLKKVIGRFSLQYF